MVQSSISKKTWIGFILFSAISFLVWFKFIYPQLAFVNISVSRQQASTIAENFIQKNYPDYKDYRTAIVFETDSRADRYLQKTLGFKEMKSFIEEHEFDMFFWLIRFFKENEKEEFRLTISSKTGEITSFKHTIDEGAHRKILQRKEAQRRVVEFLKKNFDFNENLYIQKSDLLNGFDNRNDFHFSWQKKSVSIPWTEEENSGAGKLITGAKISGDEFLSFSKNSFKIPDKFNRNMARQMNIGRNLITIVKVFYYIILCAAVFFIYIRRNHLAMQSSRSFYLKLTSVYIILSLLNMFNVYQTILFNYPTTSTFKEYILRYSVNELISIVIISASILIPSLSGELLYNEVKPKKEHKGSFLHYLQTTFLSRSVGESIVLGYFVCILMLGLQAALTKFGQDYLGVWTEYSWINRIPATTFPFLAAFIIGFKASTIEELLYRLFAINWGRKLFKNTLIAVIISSLVWGFAHSAYPVFPMWFRGIEVSCLGLLLAWIYLRFGIITVIVAHFLFDAFWSSAGFLLGTTQTVNTLNSLAVLLIPLSIAIVAFIINKEEIIRPLRWHLNKNQLFNLNILTTYLSQNREHFKENSDADMQKEILSHGWDIAVVETALEEFRKKKQ